MRALPSAWILYLATSIPVLAQNSSDFAGCPVGTASLASGRDQFNATKSAEFSLHRALGDWYLSFGLRDTRREHLDLDSFSTLQWLEIMPSVPESLVGSQQENGTEYCMYRFPPRNETVNKDEITGSCQGVLADDCVEAMENSPVVNDDGCPSIDVREKCGFNWETSTSAPSNFTNGTCAIESIPNINLPDEYRTFAGRLSSGILPADEELDDFERYDLRTRQTVPILITARRSQADRVEQLTKALCLAPDEIVEGSRKPENGGQSISISSILLFGMTVTVMVSESLGIRPF